MLFRVAENTELLNHCMHGVQNQMQTTVMREMIWKKVSLEAVPKNTERWS